MENEDLLDYLTGISNRRAYDEELFKTLATLFSLYEAYKRQHKDTSRTEHQIHIYSTRTLKYPDHA